MDRYRIIKNYFEDNINLKFAHWNYEYMQRKFKFYGLKTKERRLAYKDIIAEDKKKAIIDWELLDKSISNEYREFKYFVVDYLIAMEKYLSIRDLDKIKNYCLIEPHWDTIDNYSKIVGDIVFQSKDWHSILLNWADDDNFWIRRIAIIHQLKFKEKTDEKLLKDIINKNLGSDEFFINKAIGWALREYSKTNPHWVENYIKNNREILNKLSIREGLKYIRLQKQP